ncbi:ABC transporter ATP-binding protein [Salinibacter ruber]|uniref:ABC transporter ATP-binding protein n=1 Tax=Salinibacter ruber TaxID=146919 RepID=UPI0021687A64|nr:ABC transporter ATP-binding protein [Salinibacter ruber]MCS3702007.1 heme ABC exporter ATP-binding subunit CcmA [Salinibacter ruber]
MIEVADLYKSFGDAAVLQGASFSAAPGTATVLVGPNGSGKTTTLHVLAGLVTPDAGTARIDGTDVTTDRTAAQERLAFLPQDVRFHDALTPRQVLRFYAGLRDAPDARLDALLDNVGLADAAQKSCGALSGGMRQRLGIAVFELARAPVLLLDEPGLSLDPKWRGFLMDRLRARVEEGAAVLMATHLLDVWRPLADRVLRCEGGTVREVKPTTGAVASVDENASAV